jgi:AraC-like DNA-binding protein
MDRYRFVMNPPWPDLPQCNAVLNGHVLARPYIVARYRTTLCLKSVARGSAVYSTAGGRYLVDGDNFLLLNEGQEYSLEIEAGSNTETVCPFFQPGFLGDVARCRDGQVGDLLDDPFAATGDPGLYERLYSREGSRVGSQLGLLHKRLQRKTPGGAWLEQFFYDLAEPLLELRDGVRREVAAVPGRRPATRAELYRRLHRARDYIDTCYAEPLSVERVARVSHLSPYHFHRAFRQVFGVTPMCHLQTRRLRAASRLLIATDRPVTAVAMDVGFESLGSFSWLFRRRFGLSPRAYRAAGRKPQA